MPTDAGAAGEPSRPFHLPSVWAEAKVLGKREASDLREDLEKAIRFYGEQLDDGMPLLSKSGADVHDSPAGGIWSTLDDHDVEVLAACLLDVAQRVAPVAVVVRGIVRAYSYLEVGAILAPRFGQTVSYYLSEGLAINFRVFVGKFGWGNKGEGQGGT